MTSGGALLVGSAASAKVWEKVLWSKIDPARLSAQQQSLLTIGRDEPTGAAFEFMIGPAPNAHLASADYFRDGSVTTTDRDDGGCRFKHGHIIAIIATTGQAKTLRFSLVSQP